MIVPLLLLSLSYASGTFTCPPVGHHLVPHETDCSKFYYCEYGARRNDARQCPAGTLFSYEKQVCDHAHNVICHTSPPPVTPGCDCSDQPILANGCPCDHSVQLRLRHESNCEKFYQCERGERVLRECAPGTHFNAKLQICDHPSKAGCDPSCTTTTSTTTTSTTTEAPGCDCSDQPILANGCPCDHTVHLLLRHESNCEKYYQCLRGERLLRECAPGTHFNAKLQICDHPSKAGCDPSCTTTTSTTTTTTTTTTTEAPGCDCSDQPILANGCPCDHTVHLLLRHESNCEKYYQCLRGERVLRECTPGTHFNAELQVCDHPSKAGCDPSCTTTTSTTTTTTTTEAPGCDCSDQPILANGCPCDHTVHLLLRHESNCEKYYQCLRGERVLRECAPGTHFNAELQVCDHPSKAGCDPSCTTTTSTTTTTTTTTTTEAPGCDCSDQPILANGCPCDHSVQLRLRHESNCEKFYQCERGERVLRECAPGTHFNAELQVCEHPSKAGCDPNYNRCAGACHVPHWAHETDCDKFYRCSNGDVVLHTCPVGLNFNEALQSCDFICNVSCRSRSRLFFFKRR